MGEENRAVCEKAKCSVLDLKVFIKSDWTIKVVRLSWNWYQAAVVHLCHGDLGSTQQRCVFGVADSFEGAALIVHA